MSRRLSLAVIGLGQCGGNIANSFASYGYSTMAVNTSSLDLKDLDNIPENRKIHIPVRSSDGAGKDPLLGGEAIKLHQMRILKALEEMIQGGVDGILVTAGLGGGTGSNVAVFGSLLRKFNVPIVCMVTLPTNNESVVTKINALRSINQLVNENFDSCVLLDNDKILGQFPDSSLADFYPQANDYLVRNFNEFNSIESELSGRCLISYDNEDFRKTLFSRGLTIIGTKEIPNGQIHSLEELIPQLQKIWEESGLMPKGFDFKTTAIGSISIYAPTFMLERTSSKFLNHLGDEFKKVTEGATSYFGLYEVENSQPVRISTMLGRLAIPQRLQEMLLAATTEGESLSKKINQELPQLDISGLESLKLHGNFQTRQGSYESFNLSFQQPAPPAPQQPAAAPTASSMARSSEPQGTSDVFIKQPATPRSGTDDSEKDAPAEFKSYSLEEYVRMKKQKQNP